MTGKPVLGGGWLYALSEELKKQKDLELHIAFYWGDILASFDEKGIIYHPIFMEGEGSKLGRLINRYIAARSNKIDTRMLPRLKKVVDEVNPDIIHIHGSENNFGMIVTMSLPCPVVLSIQGLLSPYYYKLYSGFSKRELLKNEGLKSKLLMGSILVNEGSFLRRGARERMFLKRIPNIIGRTFWDEACSLALNPKRQYFEVGEILRPAFYHAKWDKPFFSDVFTIATTISFGYYKGLETVYHTARVLKEAGFSFCWNVIGISEGDMLARLSEKQVGKNAQELNVHLLGRKNAQEMVTLMKDADTFVQVSHIENSPNSLCEAMLLGMPIIATFAGGTASMLENNLEGRLVQDGEPYSMAGMIMEIAADFDHAKGLGAHARATAIKRHNPKHVCNQLLKVYGSIIEKHD